MRLGSAKEACSDFLSEQLHIIKVPRPAFVSPDDHVAFVTHRKKHAGCLFRWPGLKVALTRRLVQMVQVARGTVVALVYSPVRQDLTIITALTTLTCRRALCRRSTSKHVD